MFPLNSTERNHRGNKRSIIGLSGDDQLPSRSKPHDIHGLEKPPGSRVYFFPHECLLCQGFNKNRPPL